MTVTKIPSLVVLFPGCIKKIIGVIVMTESLRLICLALELISSSLKRINMLLHV